MANFSDQEIVHISDLFRTLDDAAVNNAIETKGDWHNTLSVGSVCIRTAAGNLALAAGLEPEGQKTDPTFISALAKLKASSNEPYKGMLLRRGPAGFLVAQSTLIGDGETTPPTYSYILDIVHPNDKGSRNIHTRASGIMHVNSKLSLITYTREELATNTVPAGTFPAALTEPSFSQVVDHTVGEVSSRTVQMP